MHPDERAAIAEALNYTEAMTRHRNACRAAGMPDPGPAAAYAAVRAAVAAPASKAERPPARMAGYERSDAEQAEAERNRLARKIADQLLAWCDIKKPAPGSDDAKAFFKLLAEYEEALTGTKPTWKYAAAADRLFSPAPPATAPAGFYRGRNGQQFSLAEALAPVHLSGSVVVSPAGSPEIAP